MVRTKQGTQGLEWTWCAGVGQNGADHIVRRKQGTQVSELTWCPGVHRKEADPM